MSDVATRGGQSVCDLLSRRPPIRKSCCIRVPSEIIHDPDPATYDQKLIFDTGGAPSFNSPDINTVDIWPLRPIADVTATVRNLSAEASANQTRVDASWSAWGIGMPRLAIATSFVDLARAGFPGSEQTLSWPLPAAANAVGLYGIFINIIHPYDSNTTNNQGEQTLDGFQTSVGGRNRTFIVPVRNPGAATQAIGLSAGPAAVAPWVTITPAAFSLAGGGQQNVSITVDVPAAIPPSPPGTLISATVDVLATAGGAYLGGVSFAILIDA